MINLYKTNGVITVGEDGKVPVTYYGRGGKSGKFYPTKIRIDTDIIIGNQVWMPYNLNVDKYRNGDTIPEVTDNTDWGNLTTGAWCYYNNDPANGEIYGKLYNWYAVNDPRGLAPVGYQIPSNEDFTELSNFLGGDAIAGEAMKESGTSHWNSPNIATNSSGFNALPAGVRTLYGDFLGIGIVLGLLSSSFDDLSNTFDYQVLQNSASNLYRNLGDIADNGRYGYAIRYLKKSNASSDFINLYNGFLINLGGDNYQTNWENLVIDGTSPTSFSNANDLLLTLFS